MLAAMADLVILIQLAPGDIHLVSVLHLADYF